MASIIRIKQKENWQVEGFLARRFRKLVDIINLRINIIQLIEILFEIQKELKVKTSFILFSNDYQSYRCQYELYIIYQELAKQSQEQVYVFGEYFNNKKEEYGNMVTFNGEYQNGKKLVDGKLCLKENIYKDINNCKFSAGGLYDEISFTKNGKWVELNESFSFDSFVTFNGQYKYGCKVGRWNSLFEGKEMQKLNLILNGGGSYDELNSIKNGEWVELSVQFWKCSQFIYRGLYEDGKKLEFGKKWQEMMKI